MSEKDSDIQKAGQKNDGAEMSFWGHLEALRWTLFRIIIVVVILFIALFLVMPKIFDPFILGPTSSNFFLYKFFASLGHLPGLPDFSDDEFAVDIININVASQFLTHMSISFYLSLVLGFPFIMYEIWKFIRPALFPKEVKNMKMAFTLGTGMFYAGCALGYCVVFPFTFRFLTEYRVSQTIVNQINLNSYMGIFITMILIMGLAFELPLLAWILSKLKLIHKDMLKKGRKYAFVGLLVLAAVITPTGDPFTLMIVFIPLYLLYELSIFLVRKKPTEGEDSSD
ncbi:MAG: twin-arginine translocase subunit TatC [Bacteroidales bacterium]|nr:twin-arginine translocase subunit TatC [Bacteroidales bacterium]